MTERRSFLSSLFKAIFSKGQEDATGSGTVNDQPKSSSKRKKGTSKRDKKRDEKIDFGIAETEKLEHFKRPKPPRRRKPQARVSKLHAKIEQKSIPEEDEEETSENINESLMLRRERKASPPLSQLPPLPPINKNKKIMSKSKSKSESDLQTDDDEAKEVEIVRQESKQCHSFWGLLKRRTSSGTSSNYGEQEVSNNNNTDEKQVKMRKISNKQVKRSMSLANESKVENRKSNRSRAVTSMS